MEQEAKKTAVKAPQKPTLTRAEKAKRQKEIIRVLLTEKEYKWNELLEEATRKYAQTHSDEEYSDLADLKGKLGSSFSVMEEKGEVSFDKKTGVCALVKKEEPKKRGRKKKEEPVAEETPIEQANEEKVVQKAEEKAEEKQAQPVAEEKPKKTRAKKTVKKQEKPVQTLEEKAEELAPKTDVKADEKPQEKGVEISEQKPEPKQAKDAPVIDLTAVFGEKKQEKTAPKDEKKEEEKPQAKKPVLPEFSFLGNNALKEKKQEPIKEEKTVAEQKPVQEEKTVKAEKVQPVQPVQSTQPTAKPVKANVEIKKIPQKQPVKTVQAKLTPDEKLKGEFLKRLRALGGEYFEYYSVYLLERYSLKNGRRLEGLRISGGNADGGIDGELELTDKFGFRETLYIQAKNWDDTKGISEKWTVGETLMQQFVGAVAIRQAKEGKRKCRGVFVTTSHFTDGAKAILESLNADFVGYDGDDVFETAKECRFGLIQKDGKWQLDEKLLSGEKAFFDLL